MKSLRKQGANLRQLAASDLPQMCGFQVPEILAFRDDHRGVWSLESYISGIDGRIAVKDDSLRKNVLVQASRSIISLQMSEATKRTADHEWIGDWVEQSCTILAGAAKTFVSPADRSKALDALCNYLSRSFKGMPVSAGRYHGDFCPGNLIVKMDKSGHVDATRSVIIAGIIDWDMAGRDAPPGFDVCQFAMALRRTLSGRQLGHIVVDLLDAGRWEPSEVSWFAEIEALNGDAALWTRTPEAMRAMVLLVWLRLVRSNIEKSPSFLRNWLWAAANVDWVLRSVLARYG